MKDKIQPHELLSPKLEANALECVRGDRGLFHELSFSLGPGELLEISGPNASGKTSLLRMLCGLLAPTSGEILWQNAIITSLNEEYLNSLAYLGHANGMKAELSATENLRIYCGLAGVTRDDTRIRAALQRLGLSGRESTPAKILSQGQQRRLALARLLIAGKVLWILDEPLAALDAEAIGLVQSMIEEHLNDGGLAVLTTHQSVEVSAGKTSKIRLTPVNEH